jgi:LysR family glycine cleavage system transcriptional activator
LNALRAFEAAARHLNFSRAADELSVTPGAVSQQIQNLEDYVGAPLFRRTPKGLLLTDAAQTALPALREAFDRLAEAASMLTAAVDGRRLTLTAAPSFAAKWLVPRLAAFEAGSSAGRRLAVGRPGTGRSHRRRGRRGHPLWVGSLSRSRGPSPDQRDGDPGGQPDLLARNTRSTAPEDLKNHVLLHDGSPDADDSCPDWTMWLAARGLRGVDGNRGPRFNQSSLVIEAADRTGAAWRSPSAPWLRPTSMPAGWSPRCRDATAVDFAYYLVHPKAKGRLPQVKAFISLDRSPRPPLTKPPCWRSTTARASDRL